MGNQFVPNFHKIADHAADSQKPFFDSFVKTGIENPDFGPFLRGLVAMSIKKIPLYTDSWDGFSHERRLLLDGFRTKTNNPIVLGGDSHDSWAYSVNEDGWLGGEKVAVNLNCAAVTSPGYREVMQNLFGFVAGLLGGFENVLQVVEKSLLADNPSLIHADIQEKGFVVVKATKVCMHAVNGRWFQVHTAHWIGLFFVSFRFFQTGQSHCRVPFI